MKKEIITIAALALLATGCSSVNAEPDEILPPKEASVETSVETSNETSLETSGEISAEAPAEDADKNSTESAKPSGTYARTITEEIEGQEISAEHYYVFNDDGTGTSTAQDTVDIKWDDNKIYFNYGDLSYEYKLDGDTLSVKEEFGWVDYTKK
ncbi:MAG: hypothetical protein IKO84_12095 [Butyrivibrio sp.]|nr:hypothetical protein [Butyrivibrio sp.]